MKEVAHSLRALESDDFIYNKLGTNINTFNNIMEIDRTNL